MISDIVKVGYGTEAEFVLTELLDNNVTLLDKYVEAPQVEQFIKLIKTNGKELKYRNR